MSNDPHTPKVNPADHPPAEKNQKPRPSDELSGEALDKATGGLLPAVGPEK